jgi:uncharacterized protein (TIGR02246 family)
MAERQSRLDDEAAIRELIEAWAAAVRRLDYEGILRNHGADFVMFDVPPPVQLTGLDAYRKSWDQFFSWSDKPIAFDIHAMTVTAGSDVAFVVATMGCAGLGTDGKSQPLDFRLTVGLRKTAGRWTITHEHHSVPAVD